MVNFASLVNWFRDDFHQGDIFYQIIYTFLMILSSTQHIHIYGCFINWYTLSNDFEPSDAQNSSFWWYQVWSWDLQDAKMAKSRQVTPIDATFQKFPYPIKKTVVNIFLVVVDNIAHSNYRKNCLEFFFQPQHVLPRGQSWTGHA